MSINIKSPRADRLARELAATTGETLTDAITTAIEQRLARERGRNRQFDRSADLLRIAAEYRELPILDDRTPDQIIGYDEHGLPT